LSYFRQYGFPGAVYAVNPRYSAIGDVRCFPDVGSIPDPVDLVVLLVPAAEVPSQIRQAAAAGIRAAVVCSSGFAEAGPSGAQLQADVVAAAREGGIALLGPNSVGLLDMARGLTASFTTALSHGVHPQPGPIALVSQSGALGVILFSLAQAEGIPIGKLVSTGNEAVLDFADCLAQVADAPDVTVVLGYVEGLRSGRRLVDVARKARLNGKVVGLLSAGHSEAGRRAALSHTGALTGRAIVQEAAFRQAGIVPIASPRAMLDLAIALSAGRFPRGPRVGIASTSGGVGVFLADTCAKGGLSVPTVSEATRAELSRVLPDFAAMANPVDYGPVYMDPDAIAACLRALASDPCIDLLIAFVALTPDTWMGGAIEERFAAVQTATDKPLIVAWLGGPADALRRLRERGVVAYDDPGRAAEAATQLWLAAASPLRQAHAPERDGDGPRRATTLAQLESWQAVGRTSIGEWDTKRLLASYGVPVTPEARVTTPQEAIDAARRFGTAVAIKAEAAGLLHKSDVGAVRLGVAPDDAATAYREVTAAAAQAGASGPIAAVVQPMSPAGLEVLAGLRFDEQFGPTITVGLGGVFSEVLADVATALAPVTVEEARAMLDRLRGAALFGPFRGSAPRDTAALAEMLAALSHLADDAQGQLLELDVNPVMVFDAGQGCLALDAVAVLT
jgi:acetyltransferase